MAKTRASRGQSYFPVKIPIYSLSGGVGRQIPSKRLPTEVDELINFQCTTESSLTKRNGTEFVGNLIENNRNPYGNDSAFDWFFPDADKDLFFYWQTIDSSTSRLYTILDKGALYSATADPKDYVTVFEITLTDAMSNLASPGIIKITDNFIDEDSLAYLHFSSSSKPIRERLKAVTIGSAVLILNTDVHAGFTSRLDGTDSDNSGKLKGLDGLVPVDNQEEDIAGADIQYLTSIAVDHKHNAEVWVESQDYTYSQQVIASQDPVYQPANNPEWPYGEFRGATWIEGRIQRGGQLRFDFTEPVLDFAFTGTDGDVGNMISLIGIESDGADPPVGTPVSKTYCFTQNAAYSTGAALTGLNAAYDFRGDKVAVKKITTDDDVLANGSADATALAAAINHTNGHGASGSLVAYANQISADDTTEYPGRVIIQQQYGVHGEQTNTSVWINSHIVPAEGDNPAVTYNLNTHTKSSIQNTFSGGQDPSIHDTFAAAWTEDISEEAGNNYWAEEYDDNDVILNQIERRHGVWRVKSYLPAQQLPGPTNELLADDEESRGSTVSPHLDLKRWERVETEDSDLTEPSGQLLNVHTSSFIPVEDYVYPVNLSAYLGQSVTRFSDLRFPPDESDLKAHNGIGQDPWAAEDQPNENALTVLYPDDDQDGHPGRGKIYHLSQAYLSNTPGWYRVIRKDEPPYLKKVRTPGKRTVLDKRRMPQLLYVDNEATYNIRPVEWDPKESGDEDSNRGPGLFFDPSNEEPKESKINTMAFYRDRLFLANDDTIVASRSGNWDNFFLADPDNITDTDPLDLMVSSNNYTPITQLVPFRDTLFVGTSGNTQYELMGSNNIISPATAEFAPTAFYPMLPEVAPVLLNNSLFFFSKEKLYVYLGARKVAAEQAFELSKHVPQYLPKAIRDTATSSHASSVFAIDTEFDDTIYAYRNQIAGDKVIQNAFYKFRIGQSSEIQPYLDLGEGVDSGGTIRSRVSKQENVFVQCWDKYLYIISYNQLILPTDTTDETQETCLSLCRLSLDEEPINIPRLDNQRNLVEGEGLRSGWWTNFHPPVYTPATNKTTITVPWHSTKADTIITGEGSYNGAAVNDEGGDIIHIKYESSTSDVRDWMVDIYSVTGDQASSGYYELFKYIGNTFTSTATLSPIYVRDEMNNLVPGTLNLRHGTIQTYDSRAFDVEVSVNNRNKSTYNFDHEISDDRWEDNYIGKTTLSGDISEHQVRFPILGYTEDVKITVISSNPHPLNVASLQFSGKFKGITRFHNS